MLHFKAAYQTEFDKVNIHIAIDFNLIPYYGEPSALESPFIYRSQAKSGDALSPKNQPALINPSLCVLVSLVNQKGWLIFYV